MASHPAVLAAPGLRHRLARAEAAAPLFMGNALRGADLDDRTYTRILLAAFPAFFHGCTTETQCAQCSTAPVAMAFDCQIGCIWQALFRMFAY